MKPNPPKIVNLNHSKKSIGCIIVPGGKTIQEIQKKTNTIITIKEEFGALVVIFGKEFLLHISVINWERMKKVEDVLKIGDIIKVKLMGIDSISRKIRLSRKLILGCFYLIFR